MARHVIIALVFACGLAGWGMVQAQRGNSTRRPNLVLVNPLQPLQVFDPPCSFELLDDGGVACPSRHVRDVFGLCAPCSWDCPPGPRVDYLYANYLPSRRMECTCYCAPRLADGGDPRACASVLAVDEELEQSDAVLQSVNILSPGYTVVEIGSRQGQWVLKGVISAQRLGGYSFVYGQSIESHPGWIPKQKEKIAINGLTGKVHLTSLLLNDKNYPGWLEKLAHHNGSWQVINHMDWCAFMLHDVFSVPEALSVCVGQR